MNAACPDITDFERLVSGELGSPESTFIESHAASCDACHRILEDVRENNLFVEPVRQVMNRRISRPTSDRPAPPTHIGSYKIAREIGRGGMGIVYEAEQLNPRRAVAIKVLHAGLGSDGRIAKMFQREAHALARLKHPSIAAIYEAGEDAAGRAFYTMELVVGLPLNEYARRNDLSIEEKLRLFRRICDAIAYAHQRGVIHRDLKPGNILIVEDTSELNSTNASVGGNEQAAHDPPLSASSLTREPSPKVLDFGLAKILEPDGSVPAVTSPNEEGRIQGTLPYMSPEQVRGDLNEIDTRSDVYSLGVILYELLTGSLPYAIDRTRLTESARVICEQAPGRMSLHDRTLNADIETIALKALEKEPARRYAGASALADDIGRFLANQPILARPPTLAYQISKMISRHKAPAALAAVMLLLVVGFGIAMSVLYSRASHNLQRATVAEKNAESEARRARQEAETAKQITKYLVDVFSVSDPEIAQGATATARQLLDKGAERMTQSLDGNPAVQATLMQTFGSVYENLGLYEEAKRMLAGAYEKRFAIDSESMDLAETAESLGNVLKRLGQLDGAELAYEKALAIMRKRQGHSADIHGSILLQRLAEVQEEHGNLDGAEDSLRELVEVFRSTPQGGKALPSILNTLAGVLASKGKYGDGVPFLREAIERVDVNMYGGAGTLLRLRGNLAWLLAQSGESREAEELIRDVLAERRRILPPAHPELATTLITLGVVHLNKNRPRDAEPLFLEASEIRTKAFGSDNRATVEARGFLGLSLIDQGRFEEAEPLLLNCFDALRRGKQASPRELAESALRLEKLYSKWGKQSEAKKWLKISIEMEAKPGNTKEEI